MIVRLANNISPPNYVNKTISLVAELEGVLREPTSIIDPVLTLEFPASTAFNYCYIPDFGRYYYVTGISSESNSLISVALHCDVLMTYKEGLKTFDAIIKRQEHKFNLYLDDGIFKSYQNSKHKIIAFPGSFSTYSYILALAGNGD